MKGLASSVVVGGGGVGRQCWDGCGESGWSLFSASGCWCAGVGAVIGSAGVAITDLDREWWVRANGALRLVGDLGVGAKGCWLGDLRCWCWCWCS